MIQEPDLKQSPLQLEVLGDIKRIMYQISALKYNLAYPDQKTKYCLTQQIVSQSMSGSVREQSPSKWSDTLDLSSSDESSSGREHSKMVSSPNTTNTSGYATHSNLRHANGFKSNLASNPLPERWKLGNCFNSINSYSSQMPSQCSERHIIFQISFRFLI